MGDPAELNDVKETKQDDGFGYPKNFRTILPQILAVSIKNMILLTFGTTLGFSTILIPALQGLRSDDLLLDPDQISWISSINLICVPVGCIVSGPLTTAIGRKRAMQFVTLPFIASWILFNLATNVSMLYSALALSGVSGGLLEAPVMIYVAEITQPYLRGALASTSTMSIIFGTIFQFILGVWLEWRIIALVNLIPPIIALIALFFVPESPQWLILNKKEVAAKESLQWLRGWTTPDVIEKEYKHLVETLNVKTANENDDKNLNYSEKMKNCIKPFATSSFAKGYSLVAFVFFLGHFCGMTTLQTYSVVIFDSLKAPMDKFVATVLLGVVELLGTVTSVGLIHFTGKRPLFFFSTLGTALCFIITATYAFVLKTESPLNFIANNSSDDTDNSLSWIPLTFLIASAYLSHSGLRLLPWVLIGEVFSYDTRSVASGLSAGIGYIFNFVSNKIFYDLVRGLTLGGTFFLYSAISIIGAIILYFALPETEGYTLAEIEQHFKGEKKLPNQVKKKVAANLASIESNAMEMTKEINAVNVGYEHDE